MEKAKIKRRGKNKMRKNKVDRTVGVVRERERERAIY